MASRFLVRGLLLFWALWFSVVFGSNLADALRELGLLSENWRFTSGNFALLASAVSLYSLSQAWAGTAFALVLVLELAAAWLFWRATLEPQPPSRRANPRVLQAFLAGIGLFCAFLVFDELLLVYRHFPSVELTHFVILCALLLSVAVICLLGEYERST